LGVGLVYEKAFRDLGSELCWSI